MIFDDNVVAEWDVRQNNNRNDNKEKTCSPIRCIYHKNSGIKPAWDTKLLASVRPGIIGLPAYSSARMHQALHKSTATP